MVRYDRRGHGKSGVPPRAPTRWSVSAATRSAILDALDIEKANWCGLSMGGMVGQWLGANAPERIDRLVLSNTSLLLSGQDASGTTASRRCAKAARRRSPRRTWSAGSPEDFREREPQIVARMKEMLLATPVEGYLACCEAVRDMDHRDAAAEDQAPDAGHRRPPRHATPIEAAEYIRSHIPGASMTMLDAAHISNVEQPDAFTDAVLGFLTRR